MMRVPKEMLPTFEAVSPVLDDFCHTFLDERYEPKCQEALAKLCRMRPSPLLGGNLNSWAAGICYFICAQNDRFGRSNKNRIPADAVSGFFGLKPSTAAAKASQIRKLFHVLTYDERYWDILKLHFDPWRVEP